MAIPTGYVKNVCRIGKGMDCCRYLLLDADGFCCGRVTPALKIAIDRRVMNGESVAQAVNCPGWTDDQPKP